MPPARMPALSLVAVPGRRRQTLELAAEIERRGFTGIYSPSPFGNATFCDALAHATREIPFGTTISPIYTRHPEDWAQSGSFLHEITGGRFRFGIGISHAPTIQRLGVRTGKPLEDIRTFVEAWRAVPGLGERPPLILATLRKRMIALAGEIADGLVFANAARSHMHESLAVLPAGRRAGFFTANMIPTVISDDIEAAKAINRRTLSRYVQLPNYRNYWKEAGYVEEMEAVEKCVADGEPDRIPDVLSDNWLTNTTLFGPASRVRDELEAWYDTGIQTPILVPSAVAGNQMKALQEVFAAFS